MSYCHHISFKKISPSELTSFFIQLKTLAGECIDEIAEYNYTFSPAYKDYDVIRNYNNSSVDSPERMSLYYSAQALFDKTRNWIMLNMFSFRYFYLQDEELLGVFSVHESLQYVFDSTISFYENKLYEFSTWDDVEAFNEVSKRWEYASYHELVDAYEEYMCDVYEPGSGIDLDYYRKVFAYNEIWGMISDYAEREECVVYLSLYSPLDFNKINQFMTKCLECCKEFYK